MAYKIMYDPANSGVIYVDNNTGILHPYKQGSLFPVWDDTAQTLKLLEDPGNYQPVLPTLPWASLFISSTGSIGFAAPASYADLVTFISNYCFITPTSSGGGVFPASLGQKAMAASFPVVIASDQSAVAVTPAATENHLGEVGGSTKIIMVNPTISTTAYTSGFCVGGSMSLAAAMRVAGGTGTLATINIVDKNNLAMPFDIFILNTTPTGTYTNNAAVVFNAADYAKVLCKVSVAQTDYATIGGTAIATKELGIAVNCASGTELTAVAVVTGTPTWSSTTSLIFKFGFYRD